MNLGEALGLASEAGVQIEKEACLIGVRGYYNKGQNQRAIYDDAIFYLSPTVCVGFNANTDPGAFREGIANLKTGKWYYRIGIHGLSKPKFLQYKALVQDAPVVVIRDQVGYDSGWFGINIHKGSYSSVSSLGCQTIHPSQWNEFIETVENGMKKYKQKNLKYILKEA